MSFATDGNSSKKLEQKEQDKGDGVLCWSVQAIAGEDSRGS